LILGSIAFHLMTH